jgi:hypothetical protein
MPFGPAARPRTPLSHSYRAAEVVAPPATLTRVYVYVAGKRVMEVETADPESTVAELSKRYNSAEARARLYNGPPRGQGRAEDPWWRCCC